MGMAQGGTPLSDFFEIVERFTPTEDLVTYTFQHTGVGRYIFCEEPVLTVQKSIDETYPTNSLYSGGGVIYESASGTFATRAETSLAKRSSSTYPVDYWGSRFTLNGDYVTIGTASSDSNLVSFYQGKTYVILKMKI